MSPEEVRGTVTQACVVEQTRALGLASGGVLLVHSSFRAVRPVQGGPTGLIAALLEGLGPEGTLVMPSWGDDDERPFDAEKTPVAADLGIVAETFRHYPGVIRSTHSQAFAALGPQAELITADPLPLPPHIPASPVGRVHDLDGQILLLGVGHDASSTIHLAEVIAEVPYGVEKQCAVLENGELIRVSYRENDHCCARFEFMDGWLRRRQLQREGLIGHAHARLMRSRDVVAAALAELAADPLVFLHAEDEDCEECRDARGSIPEEAVG